MRSGLWSPGCWNPFPTSSPSTAELQVEGGFLPRVSPCLVPVSTNRIWPVPWRWGSYIKPLNSSMAKAPETPDLWIFALITQPCRSSSRGFYFEWQSLDSAMTLNRDWITGVLSLLKGKTKQSGGNSGRGKGVESGGTGKEIEQVCYLKELRQGN